MAFGSGAIRKIHEDEAAAIAADQSFQSLLSVKIRQGMMRPEPSHGDKDQEMWLIERGILYRQWLRQKDDSASKHPTA